MSIPLRLMMDSAFDLQPDLGKLHWQNPWRGREGGRTVELNVTYCKVWSRCYATTARWAHIPGSFLDNGSVNTFPQQETRMQQWYSKRGTVLSMVHVGVIVMQRRDKHISVATKPDTKIEDLCFLRGPCRGVISGTKLRTQSVESQCVMRRLDAWCEMAAILGASWLKYWKSCNSESCKEDSESSVQESVKRGLEIVKLKNLHC
jgi:hypothetical protein